MAEAAAAEKQAAGGGGNKLILLLVLVVNVLIAGGLAYVVIMGQRNAATQTAKSEGEGEGEGHEGAAEAEGHASTGEGEGEGGHAKKGASKFGPLVEVGTLVANLQSASGTSRFAKVALVVEVTGEAGKAQVESSTLPLRNEALIYLSGLQAEQAIGPGKLSLLQDELQKRLSGVVGKDVIKRVFFSEFVIQ